MARYTVIEPLLTKAGRVEPGESVELGERKAKQLLDLGAIEPRKARAKSAAEEAEAAAKAEAERKAAEEAAAATKAEAAAESATPAAGKQD